MWMIFGRPLYVDDVIMKMSTAQEKNVDASIVSLLLIHVKKNQNIPQADDSSMQVE